MQPPWERLPAALLDADPLARARLIETAAQALQMVGLHKPRCHARQTVVIRMALLTAVRLVWQCGDHTAELKSACRGRFLITKICCLLWHVAIGHPTP